MEAIVTELAVESVKAITKVVIARAGSEKISLSWGSPEKLQRKFIYIQAFLNDIMRSANNSELVNQWLQDLKTVAYDADRLMDDYAYERLRKKHELKATERLRNYLLPSSTNVVVLRLKMTNRFYQIVSELEELNKSAQKLGLRQVELAQQAVSSAAASTSGGHADRHHVDPFLADARKYPTARDSEFIGRKEDQEKLLQLILNPSSNLSILGIQGLGGLGKTTLARRLYEHEQVNRHFGEQKGWICMSEIFKIEKLLVEIVELLTSDECELENTEAIIQKLEELLKGKKFFLVLDDVWKSDKRFWDCLKEVLQRIRDISGSVILITTRKSGVAKKACDYFHKLEGLSKEEGWTLLKQKVSNEKLNSFGDVARSIVEKCQGVPLAINSIGGLLKLKEHESDWKLIEESELWSDDPDDDNYIMPSLLLSYNDIDDVYVKQCFAYCAIFPKNSKMQKRQLIAMWLAQGLIHDESKTIDSSATVDMFGGQYIDTLANYSLLEKEDGRYETTYKMHDLVHDLAAYVSHDNLFVWKDGDKPKDADSQLKHLAFDLEKNENKLESRIEKKMMRKLRTISFWDGVPRWKVLDCARYIHTLVMVNVKLTEVPSVIGQLVHLRYLDLSRNHDIKALPDSICKLYQLQALRLLCCDKLRELPKGLDRLEHLRHIWTSKHLLTPRGLRQLTSLQTLPCLELRGGEGWTIDELGPLDQVKGELHIKGLQHVKNNEEARKAGLRRKKLLILYLSWGDDRDYGKAINDEEVLDGLEPHPNMEILTIEGFQGVWFPRWLMRMDVGPCGNSTTTQLCHLKEIALKSCKNCEQLPSLGQLRHLTRLELDGFDKVTSITDEFYGDNNGVGGSEKDLFPSLKELHIEEFKELTTWKAPSTTTAIARRIFPKLEQLWVWKCPSLGSFRIEEGVLQGVSSLRVLFIVGCSELRRMPRSLEDCTSLEQLWVTSCPSIEDDAFPDVNKLANLTELTLREAGRLTASLLKWIPQLGRLSSLELEGCGEEWNMSFTSSLPSLELLILRNFRKLQALVPEPDQLIQHLLPSSLQGLIINGFEEMEALPDWIAYLSSLQNLSLMNCRKLKYLPSEQAMSCLSQLCNLDIMDCPGLVERCDKHNGPEWPKISRIPLIKINGEIVQGHLE